MSNALLETVQSPASQSLPDWFQELQRASAEQYESLPNPTRRDESWRFANLKAFDLQDFAPARPFAKDAAADLLTRSTGVSDASGSLVFANDELIQATAQLPKGVVFLPLADALSTHGDLVKAHFMKEDPALGSLKFAALHRSSVKNGTFLYVPKGVQVEAPLQTFHWLAGAGQAVFPHTLVIAEEQSSVTLVDWYQSADSSAGLACGVNDLWVGKDASVRYVSFQDWSREVTCIQSNTTHVAAGGNATNLALHLGGKHARTESVSHLNGSGSRSDMLAVTVADNAQEFDQRTLQNHRAPHTSSDLLYKNALYDTAKTIFSGLIRVEPKAHETDAYQKVRNLLLSEEAEANSMPGLEILADQVRCSHGATTGEIDKEELFYMQARGIRTKDAYRLITFGFLNEVLERFPCNSIRETIQASLLARIAGH
ncbi:MAG: Fe-S cluster assembly protein SufD [Verrucomicrobiota bacterium]